MFLGDFRENLSQIPGLGPAMLHILARSGVTQIRHLLQYYPYRYEDRRRRIPLAGGGEEGYVNTEAEVVLQDFFWWGKKKTLKIHISDGTESGVLICFNRDFLKKQLPEGQRIRICGQFQYRFGEWQSSSFEFEKIDHPSSLFDRILPWYPLTEGLNQKTLRNALSWCLDHKLFALEDELPESQRDRRSLPEIRESLRNIHAPETLEQAYQAREALAYRELFHLEMQIVRKSIQRQSVRPDRIIPDTSLMKQLLGSLPFHLTDDQSAVLETIRSEMVSGKRINRLIQGEVGCGKTLVAFAAALFYLGTGYKVAMLAPTELLCRQHLKTAEKWLSPLGVETVLITGAIPSAERDEIAQKTVGENPCFFIGTHALFSDGIHFRNLKLVILDEQHRFGVNQRLELVEKGDKPDILMMTATPIPRTLALTVWGDLEISTIRMLPSGRLPVKTHLALMDKDDKVHRFVGKELKKGHQAYFVYPLIQQSEKLDLRDAKTMYQRIAKELFPDFTAALIHSRLTEEEKMDVMQRFSAGNIDILVATTVVEVGVDVPNATIMVVEHAERFGLSALHQLRGRVGRGDAQSYVFLVYSGNLTEEGKKRLKVMKEVNDGFSLAEEDLVIRGPGELAGYRQSGYMKFHIADLGRDIQQLKDARDDALTILSHDSGLVEPEHLKLGEFYRVCPPFDENLLASG